MATKAELAAELRQLRKEHLQGGNAVSKMKVNDLRTEVLAIRKLNERKASHPVYDAKTVGRPAARPLHNATVEDLDEDGEGVRVPVIPEKKVIEKQPQGRHPMSPEHKAKMIEASKKAREAKKAAQNEKKEVKALIKEPEGPSKSAPKKLCFCNCPSCPDKH
jgi:hypothetical protein